MIPVLNKEYMLDIESLSTSGDGVAHIDGYTLFVSSAIAGDRVSAQVTKLNKTYGFAKTMKILSPSPDRTLPKCGHFYECGGCQLMCMSYSAQCAFKRRLISDALQRIGGVNCDVDFCGAPSAYRYRNKMVFPFSEKGEWGFYKNSSHDVVQLNDCLLGDDLNPKIMDCIKDFFRKKKIKPYDEHTHSGVLRRVFIRNSSDGGIMVVISVNADKITGQDELVHELRRLSDRVRSIILNVNTKRTNLVLGDKNTTLYGKPTISDTLCGFRYDISPHSFFQINHAQTEQLYKKAIEYANISSDDIVFDLYCGIGTISLYAAKYARKVIGVEIVPDAIMNARMNAEKNGISNAEFYCAAAEDIVPKLAAADDKPNTVILDPPRKGSDEKTLSAIALASPERIVYVSCNPATLARDVKFLSENGYFVKNATGFDLFPQTVHVETIVLLQRQDM